MVAPADAVGEAVLRRYRDAYFVARSTVGIGDLIKVVAVAIAAACVIGGFVVSSSASTDTGIPIVLGLLAAAVVGVPVFILGLLISSSGQMQKAALDGAVNSSPFLSDVQRLKAMSLA